MYLVITKKPREPAAERQVAVPTGTVKKTETDRHVSYLVKSKPPATENRLVLPTPTPRPLEFIPSLGAQCSASQALQQKSIVDTVGAAANGGAGIMIIVWDFLPEKDALADVPEFNHRPGGPLTIVRNGSSAVGTHGVMVASVAGGQYCGVAKHAKLVLLGLGNDTLADLKTIERLAKDFGGPVLVNMSFALDWRGVQEESSSIKEYMEVLDEEVSELRAALPIAFFCASGNESINMCMSTEPLSFSNGQTKYDRIMCWPQFARGRLRGPVTQVGATDVQNHSLAIYSNFGQCVSGYTHGGVVCAYDPDLRTFGTTRGTSFACPLAVALAALLLSNDRRMKPKDVAARLDALSRPLVRDLPENSSNRFYQLDQAVAANTGQEDIDLKEEYVVGGIVIVVVLSALVIGVVIVVVLAVLGLLKKGAKGQTAAK